MLTEKSRDCHKHTSQNHRHQTEQMFPVDKTSGSLAFYQQVRAVINKFVDKCYNLKTIYVKAKCAYY